MAKYEKIISGQFEEVVNRLQNDILNSGISMNLVDESNSPLRLDMPLLNKHGKWLKK